MNVVDIAQNRKTELESELRKLNEFLELAAELQQTEASKNQLKPRPDQAPVVTEAPVQAPMARQAVPESTSTGRPFSDPLFQKLLAERRRQSQLVSEESARARSEKIAASR